MRLHSWWVVAAACIAAASFWQVATAAPGANAAASDAAQDLSRRVLQVRDHAGLPFAVVDKRAAVIMVYHADGTLAGTSSVLLGRAAGDGSAAGVGERAQRKQLRDDDRTTAAGRFESEPGRNLAGEDVVWIDYAAALAIHRLRPGAAQEQRAQRLTSANAGDKRISAGCVVVPVAFFERVVQPTLGRGRGVVYVMPEAGAWQDLWQELARPSL